jgi:hypothetical protein
MSRGRCGGLTLHTERFANRDRFMQILCARQDEGDQILLTQRTIEVGTKFLFRDHALHKPFKFLTVFLVIDGSLPP